VRGEGVEVEVEVQGGPETALRGPERVAGGLGVDRTQLPPEGGGPGALGRGELRPAAAREERHEVDQRQLGDGGSGAEPQRREFTLGAPLVVGAEEGEVVGGRALGGGRGRRRGDVARLLGEGPLDDPAVEDDQDGLGSEGVVEDIDLAPPQGRVDQVARREDLDGGPLLVDAPALAEAEEFVDGGEIRGRPEDGGALEAVAGRLPRLGVEVLMVALGEPGLEVGVEFVQGQGLLAPADLGLELLLDRSVESFDDAAAFALVRRGVDEAEAERGAGGER